MLVSTHIITTLNLVALPLTLFNLSLTETYIYFISASILGTLLPDIDEPNSYIGRKAIFLSYPINMLFGHRTITHNITFALLIMLFGYIYDSVITIGLSAGMLFHIIGDSVTKGGIVGALFPITSSQYKFALLPYSMRFKVGSLTEYIVLIFLSILFVYQYYTIIHGVIG